MRFTFVMHRKPLPPGIAGSLAALVVAATLAACSGGTVPAASNGHAAADPRDAQLAWARAALERNAALRVLAVDERAHIFTVHEQATGEVRTVRLEELVAAPPPSAVTAALERPPSPTPSGSTPAGSPGTSAADESATPPDAATSAAAATPPANAPAGAGDGIVVKREGGKVRISGPGVSIASADPASSPPNAGAAPSVESRGARAAANVERRVEPLICQGSRDLRLDGQAIEATGNAIVVELGCRLFVTNGRIVAGDTAIVARRGGEVHLANSTVEGRTAAVTLAAGSSLYSATSTLRGAVRREPGAELHDLGNNTWR